MSRFSAVAAALALLASGMAIGALGTYLFLARPHGRQSQPPAAPTSFTAIMESRLQLSDAQKKQIEDLIRESRRQADEIRRELRPRLEKYLEETRARFESLLTPEQRAKFDELYREDRRAERFFLETPPGPPRGDDGRRGPPRDNGQSPPPRDDRPSHEDGPPR